MNRLDNEKLKSYIEKAERLKKLGGFDKRVLKILNKILKIDPINDYALNILLNNGEILINHCKYEEAINVFNKILEINPKSKEALNNKNRALKYQEVNILCEKGKDLDNLDKYLEAIECYDKALRINPDDRVAMERKKEIMDEINEWEGVTKESVYEILKKDGYYYTKCKFRYAPKKFQGDKEIVINALRYNINAFKYASQELRTDRSFVLEVVKNRWCAPVFQFISDELRNDKEIVLEAAKGNGWLTLSLAAPNFQDDIDIVRAAINEGGPGPGLKYASPRLRSNRALVLEAIRLYGGSLEYVSPNFYNDEEVFFTAMRSGASSSFGYGVSCGFSFSVVSPWIRKKFDKMEKKEEEKKERNAVLLTDRIAEGLTNMSMYFSDYEKERRKEEREGEERENKDWQIAVKKTNEVWQEEVEQWKSRVLKWQQDQKKRHYESYLTLRVEIERMPIYKRWKQSIAKKCENRCQMCDSSEKLEVHHLDSFYSILKQNDVNSIEKAFECKQLWNTDNGEMLCKECHNKMESSKIYKKMLVE